jgi:hypothetical protein
VDLYQELVALVDALESAGIDYALCGGIAVAIHGHPRFTKDIDLLVRPQDLDRVKAIASTLGFVAETKALILGRRGPVPRTLHRLSKGGRPTVLTLDLLLANAGMEPAWRGRRIYDLKGHRLRVVSRKGLAWLKRLAGRAQDLADLEALGLAPKEDDER